MRRARADGREVEAALSGSSADRRGSTGARDQTSERREAVDRVISEYLRSHACICAWPQFIFWAGKEHGPGWQDNIQNDLVEAALKLPYLVSSKPSVPEYCLEADVYCAECRARWKFFSEEWRMLAFQERLVLLDRKMLIPSEYAGLTGAGIAATAGHEPEAGRRMLPIGEWIEFMLGRPFRTEPFVPTIRIC